MQVEGSPQFNLKAKIKRLRQMTRDWSMKHGNATIRSRQLAAQLQAAIGEWQLGITDEEKQSTYLRLKEELQEARLCEALDAKQIVHIEWAT